MAFNLKKHAQIKNYDKMLADQTKDMGLEAEESPTNYNGLLESDRVGDSVDKASTYENHLDDAREGDDGQVIAEKAMDKASGLTSRHEDGEHPMDYHKQGEQDMRKPFNLSEYNKGKGERVVDKNPGEQLMESGNKKMVGNVQNSQLLSNYDTRSDFESKNKMASVQKLADADAILYTIYRKAADESRELTKAEQNNVEKISEEKANVLAQYGGRRYYDDGSDWEWGGRDTPGPRGQTSVGTAYQEGQNARLAGESKDSNPYDHRTSAALAGSWDDGWSDGGAFASSQKNVKKAQLSPPRRRYYDDGSDWEWGGRDTPGPRGQTSVGTAYQEGQNARLAGESKDSNPYDHRTSAALAGSWDDGWSDGGAFASSQKNVKKAQLSPPI